MDDAEGVPQHDVRVFDIDISIRNPFWQTPRRISRGLWNVSTGGVDFVVIVWEELLY